MRNGIRTMVAAAALMLAAAPLAAQTAPTKIGFINTQRVISEAPGAAEAQQTLTTEMQALEAQVTAMQDSMTAMQQDYQQRSLVMSADAKARREQEILTKRNEFGARAQTIQQQAQRRQQEIMEPLMQKVEAAIDQVRQAEGYAIVFDAASDAIVSADASLDLTQKVIDRLKAAAPAAAARRP
ncbi:MAG TPA: OmpH family outer membrane protein [Longimicrobiales bacterium]|nr:OmpH family outer membrane protein [Longimicrobiales bacterium]